MLRAEGSRTWWTIINAFLIFRKVKHLAFWLNIIDCLYKQTNLKSEGNQ